MPEKVSPDSSLEEYYARSVKEPEKVSQDSSLEDYDARSV